VTIVDLPGVADANAARANIAQSYMKKVTVSVTLFDQRLSVKV